MVAARGLHGPTTAYSPPPNMGAASGTPMGLRGGPMSARAPEPAKQPEVVRVELSFGPKPRVVKRRSAPRRNLEKRAPAPAVDAAPPAPHPDGARRWVVVRRPARDRAAEPIEAAAGAPVEAAPPEAAPAVEPAAQASAPPPSASAAS